MEKHDLTPDLALDVYLTLLSLRTLAPTLLPHFQLWKSRG